MIHTPPPPSTLSWFSYMAWRSNFGMCIIAGPQTPPQKPLSSAPIWMKQKPKDRSWSKLSFFEKKFRKSLQLFPKIQKPNFQKSPNFGLKFFLRTNQKILRNPHFSTLVPLWTKKLRKIFKILKKIFFKISKFLIFQFFFRLFRTF